jgi:hypothetical protein
MSISAELLARARDRLDLTDPDDRARLYTLAESLGERSGLSSEDLRVLAGDATLPLDLKLAAKLAESRAYLSGCHATLDVGVVFAMWGEHNRLRPRGPDNPNGEDLLRVKLEQLDWATRGTRIRWRLYAVDDGCPQGSGRIAAELAAGHPLGERARVLELAGVLPARKGPLAGLASADDSRKGGAVIYGCLRALDDGAEAVVYTDADTSVHLGQLGLLLRPHLEERARVVLGDRKAPGALLVKQESRWGVGIKTLRHIQRRVGFAVFGSGIRDTQAAFKLYERGVLERILERPTVYDFSFDTDWLAAVVSMREPFACVPFAFIDSFEESASIAQGPMTTWLTLLKGLASGVRARGLPHDEEMTRVLDDEIHEAEDLEALLHRLPPELEHACDEDLGSPDLMPASAVRDWIRACKAAVRCGDAAPPPAR